MWKLPNVTSIFKKDDEQLLRKYRPISPLHICGKNFEKIISNNLYNHLTHLITKNQSGFRPGDTTANQLIDLVNDFHHILDNTNSLELVQYI